MSLSTVNMENFTYLSGFWISNLLLLHEGSNLCEFCNKSIILPGYVFHRYKHGSGYVSNEANGLIV